MLEFTPQIDFGNLIISIITIIVSVKLSYHYTNIRMKREFKLNYQLVHQKTILEVKVKSIIKIYKLLQNFNTVRGNDGWYEFMNNPALFKKILDGFYDIDGDLVKAGL
jgi:hypothetical protein